MGRIHTVFFDLKPVALPHGWRSGEEFVTLQLKGIQNRERRPTIRRPHVGKDQPPMFVNRIGAVKEAVLQSAVSGLPGCFKDSSVDVEEPTVIAASDAHVADQAKLKRGAAMRAMQFQ